MEPTINQEEMRPLPSVSTMNRESVAVALVMVLMPSVNANARGVTVVSALRFAARGAAISMTTVTRSAVV